MKESKYQDHFDRANRLIDGLWSVTTRPQGNEFIWKDSLRSEIFQLEEIIKKLERENIGPKQTNLNQKEKLEKYFNGIK